MQVSLAVTLPSTKRRSSSGSGLQLARLSRAQSAPSSE